jgi:hypothetical protein
LSSEEVRGVGSERMFPQAGLGELHDVGVLVLSGAGYQLGLGASTSCRSARMPAPLFGTRVNPAAMAASTCQSRAYICSIETAAGTSAACGHPRRE